MLAPKFSFAVDGVGLFEMFPFLGWFFFYVALTISISVLLWGFNKKPDESRSLIRIVIAIIVSSLLLTPFIRSYSIEKLANSHKKELCSSKAITKIIVSPDEWQPSKGKDLYPRYEILSSKESRSQIAGNLYEYRIITHQKYYVWEEQKRLVDEATGRLLMYTVAYHASRISHPYGCGGNEKYLKNLPLYQNKVWDLSESEH